MSKTYRIPEEDSGGYNVELLDYDEEARDLTTISGVKYDEEDYDILGVNLLEEFEKSGEDILCFRNDELELDIEITKKY